MNTFTFELQKTKNKARAGVMTTPHGAIETPVFMPVGTQGSVKSLDSHDVENTGAQILLGNTYHLYLRPGVRKLEQYGGLHALMNWQKPILTDSGGFQVFSLGLQYKAKEDFEVLIESQAPKAAAKISESGVEFTSHLDGSKHVFTPSSAIEIQRSIGADIIMAFDECTPDDASPEYAAEACDRTHRWAQQCIDTWNAHDQLSTYGKHQALFGIIQGGMHQELRIASAKAITALPFEGIAVGGETVGYNMFGTAEMMGWIEPLLPVDKPRYAMGLGRDPQDIIDAILMGFDMFDCVGPTRLARNGALYAGHLDTRGEVPEFVSEYKHGRISINKTTFANDTTVIQEGCTCFTCSHGYSRAYLHHLSRTKELSYYRLASIHNVHFMVQLAKEMRAYING
ncbi:MAG: tRNA guanosine(34) transglycosylase Tgt [bacterium]|nr:tRNA guanosine(34) transglycosylase Tgt [bacterium]